MTEFKMAMLTGSFLGVMAIISLNQPIEPEYSQDELQAEHERVVAQCAQDRRAIYNIDFSDDMVEFCEEVARGQRVL